MSTSAPVKAILVVDLTHVLNDPFVTTILCDLRARLIPPTRVGGPNGQPPRARAAAVVGGALFEGRGSEVAPGVRRSIAGSLRGSVVVNAGEVFYWKMRRRLAAWRRRWEMNARTPYPSGNPINRPIANIIDANSGRIRSCLRLRRRSDHNGPIHALRCQNAPILLASKSCPVGSSCSPRADGSSRPPFRQLREGALVPAAAVSHRRRRWW
jgi:hypothetical protein